MPVAKEQILTQIKWETNLHPLKKLKTLCNL